MFSYRYFENSRTGTNNEGEKIRRFKELCLHSSCHMIFQVKLHCAVLLVQTCTAGCSESKLNISPQTPIVLPFYSCASSEASQHQGTSYKF